MSINLNPTYSPVWAWLRDHAAALLALAVAQPELVNAVAGPHAPAVQAVLGALVGLGIIGKRYAKPQP